MNVHGTQMSLEEAREMHAQGESIPKGTAFAGDDYAILVKEGVLGPKRATVARRGTATRSVDTGNALDSLLVQDALRRRAAAATKEHASDGDQKVNAATNPLLADAERRRIAAEKKGQI